MFGYLVILMLLFFGGVFCDDVREEEDNIMFVMVSNKGFDIELI